MTILMHVETLRASGRAVDIALDIACEFIDERVNERGHALRVLLRLVQDQRRPLTDLGENVRLHFVLGHGRVRRERETHLTGLRALFTLPGNEPHHVFAETPRSGEPNDILENGQVEHALDKRGIVAFKVKDLLLEILVPKIRYRNGGEQLLGGPDGHDTRSPGFTRWYHGGYQFEPLNHAAHHRVQA